MFSNPKLLVMKKSLRRFLSHFFALTLLGGPLLLGTGCTTESDTSETNVAILVDGAPGLRMGATVEVALPVSGMTVEVRTHPEMVPLARILDLKLAEAGEPDMRHLCFVAYVDGDALRLLNRLSLDAKGRKLFLVIGDTVVGVHPVMEAIDREEIFFISEVPGSTREARLEAMSQHLSEATTAILASRKATGRR